MSGLLQEIQSRIPLQKEEIAQLWIALWAHPDGLALTQILDNLSLAIKEWCQRFPQVPRADNDTLISAEKLESWSELIATIRAIIPQLPDSSQQAVARGTGKNPKSHPLSKHGLTAHGIYCGCWNRHESTDASQVGLSNASDAGPALRRLQLFCLQAQAALVEAYAVTPADYLSWLDLEQNLGVRQDKPENSAKRDFFQTRYTINTHAVGKALRLLSWKMHQPLLLSIDLCFQKSASATLHSLSLLEAEGKSAGWRSDDAVTEVEREDILSSLRRFFEHSQNSGRHHASRRSRKATGGENKTITGYLGTLPIVTPVEPPELLPELENWVTTDEVGIADEGIAVGDDTESPKKTGLQLIRPEDIAGHLAKLKAQQHHCAMLRQNFSWDSAALTDSENQTLRSFLQQLLSTAQSLEPSDWLPKAMVALSWLAGCSLAEAAQLRVLAPSKIKQSGLELAVANTDQGVVWRLPLRIPPPSRNEYDGRLARVNHIVVPDISGLGAAILSMHQRRELKSELVFAWTKNVSQRGALADLEIKQLDDAAGGMHRIVAVRIARSLRMVLLNRVPDKTIAWMVAGTAQEAIEPRMFYAAHTPDELRAWTLQAQAELLQLKGIAAAEVPRQTLSGATGRVVQKTYAGARFIPDIEQLRRLCLELRRQAQLLAPEHVLKAGRRPINKKRSPERHARKLGKWNTVECWRQWHDDVVMWVWLVQSLHTGMRAITHPSHLYLQWLRNPQQQWLSLEDKVTRDHDESRAAWLSPLLREAFSTLTATQEAYAHRWLTEPKRKRQQLAPKQVSRKKPAMPYGFVVFNDDTTPKALRPRWVMERLKLTIDVNWPANFSRPMLRRALAERGLSGDALDAFLGHGAFADRVHDRHSLFEPHRYAQELQAALQDWTDAIGLGQLLHRLHLKKQSGRFHRHQRLAVEVLDRALGFAEKPKVIMASQSPRTADQFDQWCEAVHQLTGTDNAALRELRQWHALLSSSTQSYSKYLLLQEQDTNLRQTDERIPADRDFAAAAGHVPPVEADDGDQGSSSDLFPLARTQRAQADALEHELIQALLDGKLNRPQTAFGFNLAYKICRALNPRMPTMRLALSGAARVSPFTTDRLRIAAKTQDLLQRCRQAIRPSKSDHAKNQPQTDSSIQLALASFLNVTSNASRWQAMIQRLAPANREHATRSDDPFGHPFEYKVSGLGHKTRLQRGFVDVISGQLTPSPASAETTGVKELFAHHKPRLTPGPAHLGAWTNGIHWWSRLLLPPLVAEHFAAALDDQCASGPWGQRFAGQSDTQTPAARRQEAEADWQEQAIVPSGVVIDEHCAPFGWSCDLKHANEEGLAWLRGYLLSQVGPQRPDSTAPAGDQTTLGLLNDALSSAQTHSPAQYRSALVPLIRSIRKRCDLEMDSDSESAELGVDRHVVDWDTYEKFLATLGKLCITGRFKDRQQRLRLLIVLAFRFGMRRQEILGLRRIDVDLIDSGRIHIRPYHGHPLKTGFSARCLPITVLLPDTERSWLAQACHGLVREQLLFPQSEHDTLPRDAINLIRQESADPLLKLHHLRHSFASLLTLKVVLARHPEWLGAFTPWPQTWQALQKSSDLIGALIKPHNAAADFLVVPRLLGHSSYEVTLTNYTHTLEIVGALYQSHVVSQCTLPDREVGLLIHRRFNSAKSMRDQAMTWPANHSGRTHPGNAGTEPGKTRAVQFEERLRSWLVRGEADDAAGEHLPKGLTQADVINWFTPHHATELRDKLLAATNLLSDADVPHLLRLGNAYWQADPPMFWFSSSRHVARTSTDSSVVDDALSMIRLLHKLGFGVQYLGLWRYANADELAHCDFWYPVLATAGLEKASHLRHGRATTVQCLGVTLAVNGHPVRSQLLNVWWRGCCQSEGEAPP